MRINEVTYEKLKTPLKVNGNLKLPSPKQFITELNSLHYIVHLWIEFYNYTSI